MEFSYPNKMYHLLSCPGCGILYLDPRPSRDDLINLYNEASYTPFIDIGACPSNGSRRVSNAGRSGVRKTFLQNLYKFFRPFSIRWKARLIEKRQTTAASILDIGCGTGVERGKAVAPE